MKAKQGLKG